MAPFTKPEAVLKQADGLISVGQHEAALQSLVEVFASKRFRNTPLSSLEPIMIRFVSLCVDLRQGRIAKEGLMQYKNLAQNSSVASIEVVIKKFISLCEDKVAEAQEKANRIVGLADVDDLEASETPESILLGAVSGDQTRDRTDRALVTPWLKFLWEAYRTALETLKNNNRLEAIYHQIVLQAFRFCLTHSRKVEFRRLCETLRLHLANVAKYAHQPHSINLSDPETLQAHLDARFAQLNTSVELELWQEAYRSVEDVHNLLTLAKKAPRPAMMANYYEKLARIFLTSGSTLFHAAAWSRYYGTVRVVGGKSEEEMSKLAGLVLISALAVPLGADGSDDGHEETKGRSARLTTLLWLTKTPSRAALLKDALSRNTLKTAPEPIRQLYQILEVNFHPLTVCASIAPILQALAADPTYSPYLPLLHKVLLSRLLHQLSQVYSSVKISHVLELVAPLNASTSTSEGTSGVHYDHPHIEAFVMGCAQRGELQVRVDHAQGSITFNTDAFASIGGATSPASLIRTRLSRLATVLSNSISYLAPAHPSPNEEEQAEQFATLVESVNEERARLQLNRTMALRRAELLAELTARRTTEEHSRKLEESRRQKEQEEKRAAELAKKRERERIEKELEAMRAAEARKLAETLIEKGTLKVDVKALDVYDSDKLLAMQVEQLDQEKKALSDRTRIIARRLDHTERAFRREEKALLAEDYAKQQEADKKAYEQKVRTTKETARAQHTEALEVKKRLGRMMQDYKAARVSIAGKKEEEYREKVETAKAKMEAEKARRREKILREREEERRRIEEEERAEREAREAEEREERERREAEERRREEEETARAEKERTEREAQEKAAAAREQRELERQRDAEEAKKRMQREEEALEKRRLERERERAGPTPKTTPPSGGSWVSQRAQQAQGGSRPESPSPLRPSGTAYRPPGARGATLDSGGAAPPARAEPAAPPPTTSGIRPGGWREREAQKAAAAAAASASNGRDSPQPSNPPPPPRTDSPKPGVDTDGFQTVQPKQQAWKPRHLR